MFLLDTFKRKHITPATLQDVALMEEAGVLCAPPRRLHGKHRAPVVLPPQPPVTKKRPVPKGKAAAKSKTKRREATPPSVEDLVANGHLPEESVERYEGLCAADLDELKEMTQELWLPDHGAVHGVGSSTCTGTWPVWIPWTKPRKRRKRRRPRPRLPRSARVPRRRQRGSFVRGRWAPLHGCVWAARAVVVVVVVQVAPKGEEGEVQGYQKQ